MRSQKQQALELSESVQALLDSMVGALLAGQGLAAALEILHGAFGVAVIATDWRNVVIGGRPIARARPNSSARHVATRLMPTRTPPGISGLRP